MGLDTSLIKEGSIDDVQFRAKRAKDQTSDSSYYIFISGRKLTNFKENIKILIKYLEAVDEIFNFISNATKEGNPEKYLKGPICRAGFKRLT